MTMREYASRATEREEEPLPDEIRERIIFHGETAPYHRRLQREQGIDYEDLQTWADLRTSFDYLDDEALRSIDPAEFVPDQYSDDELVLSRSSGTTGDVKEIYWHEADLEANVDNVVTALSGIDVPEDAHWLGTVTPNPVLKRKLRLVASRFDSTIETVEVDPAPVKRALQSGDPNTIEHALEPIAAQLRERFDAREVAVYEDIAPLMQYVSSTLSVEHRNRVDLALVGGVGTDAEAVAQITSKGFPNATLTGWYGDYMNGSSMMCRPATLEYVPHVPDVRLEVRDATNIDRVVPVGRSGELVSHAIRRGFFVPNRRIGDIATRITTDGRDGVAEIGRQQL